MNQYWRKIVTLGILGIGVVVVMIITDVPTKVTVLLATLMAMSLIFSVVTTTDQSFGKKTMFSCFTVLLLIGVVFSMLWQDATRNVSKRTGLTPIQEQFISQSTMTAHSINSTYSVLSVGKELAPGLHEVKVSTGSGKNERMVIFSALYCGKVKGGEEVDLIRIEQSGSDPYEKLNGQRSSFLLANPRVVKVDLKNDPYPGMQREEVER
jgi:hypothetical protein